MNYYNLTGSQNFYGQKDVKTYYNVPSRKVWDGLKYMSDTFNLPVVFVYQKVKGLKLGQFPFVGTYSRKYGNFRTPDGVIHQTFNF